MQRYRRASCSRRRAGERCGDEVSIPAVAVTPVDAAQLRAHILDGVSEKAKCAALPSPKKSSYSSISEGRSRSPKSSSFASPLTASYMSCSSSVIKPLHPSEQATREHHGLSAGHSALMDSAVNTNESFAKTKPPPI